MTEQARLEAIVRRCEHALAASQPNDALSLAPPGKGRAARVGDLVELNGQIVGNPLEQLLEMYERMLPYAGVRGTPPAKTKSEAPRIWWWPWATKKMSTLVARLVEDDRNRPKLVHILREDLAKAHVRDLLMEVDDLPGGAAVLVVSNDFFSGRAADYLLDGRFTVLGKVTRILVARTPVDLKRRLRSQRCLHRRRRK